MTKLKDVDPNSPTGRRVIADLKSKLDTNDRDDAISFGKKYGIFKNVPVKPAYTSKKDGGLMEAIEKVKAKEMETGGEAVPKKFKGFSKLPEAVQEKMDPTLAKKFEDGGPVKMGSGGGVCRGMGAARAGGKFKLR